ncbi:hypothetical protein L208DRAFT_1415109 [Tricholoma matsutake]|nr:hypothetical protein L208DRAFT_1415109 [Tricholoma matsutake 945]
MDSIIVDDNSSQFTYGGSPWAEVTASNFYGGSSTFPAGAQDGSSGFVGYGTLSFVFEGTAVAFFGNTPAPNDSQWVMVSIDGGTAGNTSYMDPSPPSTRQWYQSPTLPDAKHTIDITHIAATSVDYAVVTVGPQTNLAGVTLIVDDSSPDITYAGSWTRSNSFTSNGGPPIGLPYGNATHRTSSNGASATFSFTGTGVSVGGIFTWNIIGAFSVKYTLDGVSSTQDYTVTSSAQQFVNGERQQPNFIFFSRNSLSPGQHTLQMQLVNSVNQVFELDYITYTPSFNALASTPPNTNPSTTSPSTTSPSIPNTSTANPSTINASTTNTSTTNTSTAGASTTSASTSRSTIISPGRLSSQTTTTSTSTTAAGALVNASTSKSIPVGAIAGAVAGGVICLLLLLLLLCRKRRSNHRTSGPFRETMASFGTFRSSYIDTS